MSCIHFRADVCFTHGMVRVIRLRVIYSMIGAYLHVLHDITDAGTLRQMNDCVEPITSRDRIKPECEKQKARMPR